MFLRKLWNSFVSGYTLPEDSDDSLEMREFTPTELLRYLISNGLSFENLFIVVDEHDCINETKVWFNRNNSSIEKVYKLTTSLHLKSFATQAKYTEKGQSFYHYAKVVPLSNVFATDYDEKLGIFTTFYCNNVAVNHKQIGSIVT